MNENYFDEIGLVSAGRGLLSVYCAGFALSLACTLGAYLLVVRHALTPLVAVAAVVALALVQVVAQGFCFLHVSFARSSRAKLFILGFALLVVTILVSGSLWIITTLNGRMMPSTAQMEQYMQDQSGF